MVPTSVKTELVVIILDVPVIAKCRLKCYPSEVCLPELHFQSGMVGWEKEHFLFIKSKGFKWVGFHSLICFQLLGWAAHGRKC